MFDLTGVRAAISGWPSGIVQVIELSQLSSLTFPRNQRGLGGRDD